VSTTVVWWDSFGAARCLLADRFALPLVLEMPGASDGVSVVHDVQTSNETALIELSDIDNSERGRSSVRENPIEIKPECKRIGVRAEEGLPKSEHGLWGVSEQRQVEVSRWLSTIQR